MKKDKKCLFCKQPFKEPKLFYCSARCGNRYWLKERPDYGRKWLSKHPGYWRDWYRRRSVVDLDNNEIQRT